MSTPIEPTDTRSSPEETPVQRILLEGLPWERNEQISACFPDSRALRLTYIDGSLEIMSPVGAQHGNWKGAICLLLVAYFEAEDMRFHSRGGFTLKEPERAGGEPDASYCIGTDKAVRAFRGSIAG